MGARAKISACEQDETGGIDMSSSLCSIPLPAAVQHVSFLDSGLYPLPAVPRNKFDVAVPLLLPQQALFRSPWLLAGQLFPFWPIQLPLLVGSLQTWPIAPGVVRLDHPKLMIARRNLVTGGI